MWLLKYILKCFASQITGLDDTDLIRHLQKWKDTAKQMRDIMHQVTQQVQLIRICFSCMLYVIL